jgi:hypothetical protein
VAATAIASATPPGGRRGVPTLRDGAVVLRTRRGLHNATAAEEAATASDGPIDTKGGGSQDRPVLNGGFCSFVYFWAKERAGRS